MAEKLSGA